MTVTLRPWRERIRDALRPTFSPPPPLPENEFALSALERHKKEGMILAVQARWIALAVIGLLLPIINFRIEMLWYEAFLLVFALIGWLQLRVARVGTSRAELFLIISDFALMSALIMAPNPLQSADWPLEMQMRFGSHTYLFVFLAFGTLAYSWRTVRGIGTMAGICWTIGAVAVWYFSSDHPSGDIALEAFADYPRIAEALNPVDIQFDQRLQEIVIFILVAFILSMTVRRFSDLLMTHTAVERERANLARYFSPNVVDELSQNDEPLKQIRTQDVAVLFVDIVGFTSYSSGKDPEEVIRTLREFHARMEAAVFAHGGTLDKYLGDGLMATFGTPTAGQQDALNALKAAQAMTASMAAYNAERASAGEEPLKVGLGLHYGPCVLGDIGGGARLEFAVIGDTVNVASRVEAKTRELGVEIAMTEEMAAAVREKANGSAPLDGFDRFEGQEIRGLSERVTLIGA
ncbi:MAG: adenylate/guanylate cyclase domain-containing protein [Pseudomonadota bacterium]